MRKGKKALKQRPYNFDYDLEFAIYKQIGKEKKGRKAKAIEKQGIEIPNKYSTWKAGVIERYPKLINNEDFFHFLRAEVRRSKGFHDLTVAVATPIEVAVLSILLSFLGPQHVSLLSIILLTFFLTWLLSSDESKSRTKTAYFEDLIEILCPKYADKS